MRCEDVKRLAYAGVIGIDENLAVFGGYDNQLDGVGANYKGADQPISDEEKRRLADYMIGRWMRYKAEVMSKSGGDFGVTESEYRCGVLNCGNDKCVHKLISERCPHCGKKMVEVVTTGFKFCSNHESICDYEVNSL